MQGADPVHHSRRQDPEGQSGATAVQHRLLGGLPAGRRGEPGHQHDDHDQQQRHRHRAGDGVGTVAEVHVEVGPSLHDLDPELHRQQPHEQPAQQPEGEVPDAFGQALRHRQPEVDHDDPGHVDEGEQQPVGLLDGTVHDQLDPVHAGHVDQLAADPQETAEEREGCGGRQGT